MDFTEKELRDKAMTTITNTPTCTARAVQIFFWKKNWESYKNPILKESLVPKMRIYFADFLYRQNKVNQR